MTSGTLHVLANRLRSWGVKVQEYLRGLPRWFVMISLMVTVILVVTHLVVVGPALQSLSDMRAPLDDAHMLSKKYIRKISLLRNNLERSGRSGEGIKQPRQVAAELDKILSRAGNIGLRKVRFSQMPNALANNVAAMAGQYEFDADIRGVEYLLKILERYEEIGIRKLEIVALNRRSQLPLKLTIVIDIFDMFPHG